MPHYKNGTEAKLADLVIQEDLYGNAENNNRAGSQQLGVLTSINPGAETCNGTLAPMAQRKLSPSGWGPWMPVVSGGDWSVTIGKCYKIEVGEGTPPPTSGGPGSGGGGH